MLWHILKHYMSVVVAVFYKRTQIKNLDILKIKAPAILAMNHPNAFADPIGMSSMIFPPRTWYLARGDAFKKGIVTTLLQSLGIIPIFRIQDGGKEGLSKNNETYNIVNRLLLKKKKIIVFAEGLCIQERRLRPLKKGVPRMAFGSIEEFPQLKELVIIPVGVNYSWPVQFRGTLFYNVGQPIKMSDYLELYQQAPAKAMNQLMADLTEKMKELIVVIEKPENETIVEQLEKIYRATFFKKNNLNAKDLEHDLIFSKFIANSINAVNERKADMLNELKLKTTNYNEALTQLKLKDWLIKPNYEVLVSYPAFFLGLLFLVLTLPVYTIGFIGNYWIYKVVTHIVKNKIKLIEFRSSFSLGLGAVLFLINYSIIFTITYCFFGLWVSLGTVFLFAICGHWSLLLSPLRKKIRGIYRFLNIKRQKPATINQLKNDRMAIISLFERLILD